ncbi:hypothetical protein LR69_02814 [Geobacillus sp. BCO2]|nr:hypothetical protein LR69_02814 [Geobacillus sp. BCO2]
MRKWWKRLRFIIHVRRFSSISVLNFLFSREVPMRKKAFSVGLFLLYMVLPFDLIPDWLALFGLIDDFGRLPIYFAASHQDGSDFAKGKI